MQYTGWKDIAELVGIVAIVASLIFVGLQMKQSQDITLSETDVSFAGNLVEFAALTADHAELWNRGNAGEELSAAELEIYSNLLSSKFYLYMSNWRRNSRFGQRGAADISAARFAVFLSRNPGARATWLANRSNSDNSYQILGFDQTPGNQFTIEVLNNLNQLDQEKR